MSYEIQKNVPVPDRKHWREKYPFARMEVGDSFLVPIAEGVNTEEIHRRLGAARSSTARAVLRNGVPAIAKFIGRKEEKDGKTIGVRVWRTE